VRNKEEIVDLKEVTTKNVTTYYPNESIDMVNDG
jgi:hypothetical protein